jgi:hypothetical protein
LGERDDCALVGVWGGGGGAAGAEGFEELLKLFVDEDGVLAAGAAVEGEVALEGMGPAEFEIVGERLAGFEVPLPEEIAGGKAEPLPSRRGDETVLGEGVEDVTHSGFVVLLVHLF